MRWQSVLKYTSGGTIGLFVLLASLLNLTGMNSSFTGDQVCGTDCYSEVRVNSTYWQVCVEHAGEKDVIFKKRTRSRTLWINLDKIDEFIITDPQVKVELNVPARGKGNWRPVKDGDCIIKRRTKSNPRESRIQIHGIKTNPSIDVKWSFELEHYTIENIIIDPLWKGVNISINNFESCRSKTNFYNISVNDYGNVIKTRDTFGLSWNNTINNYSLSINGTENYQSWEKTGSHIETLNTTKCVQDTSYLNLNFGSKIILLNYSKFGWKCSNTKKSITCDMCWQEIKGVRYKDGNCDGKITSGESYFLINATHIIADNNKLGMVCGNLTKKGITWEYCIDKSFSSKIKRLI